MKKYYLHDGTESSGPFDIAQLKALKITTKSPIWFEGMERWKTAGEIEELVPVFLSIPPIAATVSPKKTVPPTQKIVEEPQEQMILGLSKVNFSIACVVLLVIIGSIAFNVLQESRSKELELKNHKTEVENYKYEIKQREIEEQKIQMVIQEKIDSERLIKNKKQSLQSRISEIDKSLATQQNNISATEEEIIKASAFKLLRSSSEKEAQLSALQKSIESYKKEIQKLKNESDQLKLELEKIPS